MTLATGANMVRCCNVRRWRYRRLLLSLSLSRLQPIRFRIRFRLEFWGRSEHWPNIQVSSCLKRERTKFERQTDSFYQIPQIRRRMVSICIWRSQQQVNLHIIRQAMIAFTPQLYVEQCAILVREALLSWPAIYLSHETCTSADSMRRINPRCSILLWPAIAALAMHHAKRNSVPRLLYLWPEHSKGHRVSYQYQSLDSSAKYRWYYYGWTKLSAIPHNKFETENKDNHITKSCRCCDTNTTLLSIDSTNVAREMLPITNNSTFYGRLRKP